MNLGFLAAAPGPAIVGTRFGPKRRFAGFGAPLVPDQQPNADGSCPDGYEMDYYVSGQCEPDSVNVGNLGYYFGDDTSGDGSGDVISGGIPMPGDPAYTGDTSGDGSGDVISGSVVDAGKINQQSGVVEDTLLAADALADKILGTHWAADRFAKEAAAAGTPLSQAQIDDLKTKDQALINQAQQQTVQQVEDAAVSGLTMLRMVASGLAITAGVVAVGYVGYKVYRRRRAA